MLTEALGADLKASERGEIVDEGPESVEQSSVTRRTARAPSVEGQSVKQVLMRSFASGTEELRGRAREGGREEEEDGGKEGQVDRDIPRRRSCTSFSWWLQIVREDDSLVTRLLRSESGGIE